MKNLLIIGARGWGREVFDIATACINSGMALSIKGFLDDKADALSAYLNYPPIIGPVETYEILKDDVFVCALGDVHQKKHYTELVLNKGGVFVSLIHPTAIIGNNARIGKGCIVGANALLSSDITLGDHVTFNTMAGIGHDSCVGDYSYIGAMSNISGFVKIGNLVTIYPCCNIVPHRTIKDGATLGTGSVVLINVNRGETVFGNPAKKITI